MKRKLLLALPPLYAGVTGLWQVIRVNHQTLDPDAQTYLAAARNFGLLSLFGGFSEPVWPSLLAPAVKLLGAHPEVIRVAGVAAFVLLVVAFQVLAGRLHGTALAAAGALALAVSPWLIYQSARGLREEASAALFVLYAWLAVRAWRQGSGFVGLAALAAFVGMLRWDTLYVTTPVLGLIYLLRRPALRHWVLGAAVYAAILTPFLAGNWIRNGDPLYSTNLNATYFRNVEFHDQPGFPTLAETEQNSAAGSRVTWGQYLFGLHTPGQIASRAAYGAAYLPLKTTYTALFYPNRPAATTLSVRLLTDPRVLLAGVLTLVGAAGCALLLRTAWPPGAMAFLAVAEFSPVATLMDSRVALSIYVFVILGVLQVLWLLWPPFRKRVGWAR